MNAWINEFHYDNDGTDTGEFIEVAAVEGTDLTGWSLVLYNGNGGAVYDTVALNRIANVINGIGFSTVDLPVNGLQNGAPDGIALVDDTGTVVEFISYEGSFTAVGGPADGLTSTDIGVFEPGDTIVGTSIQRQGIGREAADFSAWQAGLAETPDAVNEGQTIDEDSGTGGGDEPAETEVFGADAAFTLQLFHAADQEGGQDAVRDADNFSAVLNALRDQDIDDDGTAGYENTLTLSSGDAWIPGAFYDASEAVYGAPGVADVLIQNELGFQAIAFGNHEFDQGTGPVRTLLTGEGVDGFDGAEFPYLASNLDFSTDANLADLEVEGGQAPTAGTVTSSTVLTTEGGEEIGVVGVVTPALSSISSPGNLAISPENFDFPVDQAELEALAAVIQAEVDALLDANPGLNKVILLSHQQQIGIETDLIALLSNVDIVVAGGSNTLLTDSDDTLRPGDESEGQYGQFLDNADGGKTVLVNTDGNYKYVGRLVVDFDDEGRIIEAYDPTISGAYATDTDSAIATTGAADEDDLENFVDPEIDAITDAIEEELAAIASNVVGFTDVFLNGIRGDVRTQETNLGNLSADANLVAAKEADPTVVVSFKNGGGIRAPIGEVVVPAGGSEFEFLPPQGSEVFGVPEGAISQLDLQTALSFNNGLTLLDLTRADLVQVLENAIGQVEPGNTAGAFPQVAGLNFSFDLDRPVGDRIVTASIVDENGEPIANLVQDGEIVGDPNETFRIVTLNFLADFGDGTGLDTLGTNRVDLVVEDQFTGASTFAEDGSEQDALAEYLAANFATSQSAFSMADMPPELDMRIQNLEFREDTVPVIVEQTAIYDIQGQALTSPFEGEQVVTGGIVTAVDSNGFYLQDAEGDGDITTSDAIFVFTSSMPTVLIGDEITIEATVSEFFPGGEDTGNQSTTQLSSVVDITVITQGNDLPEAVLIGAGGRTIPTESIDDDPSTYDPVNDGLDFFESLEGMRVTVEDYQVVAGTNRFGEIFGTSGPATGVSERGTLNISPDDFNPERIQIDEDSGVFDFDFPEVKVGDTIESVTGVVGYSFGNYEILPTEALGPITDGGLEQETTDLVASPAQLTIASYNVLNLDPEDSDDRFDALAEQILNNLGTPDIIGLQEIQDNSGSTDDGTVAADETLQKLIDAIDMADDGEMNGSTPYKFIDNTFIADGASGGQPGGNIRTAFLYNSDRVTLVDGSVRTIGGQGEGEAFEGARLPLVAEFEFLGEEVTVINNHFSSKGGSEPILGRTQPFEELQNALDENGDPVVNGSLDERLRQAEAVAQEVEALLADDPDAKVAVVGDLNEFEFVSPVTRLEEAGLTNLTNTLPEDERYSFIFQGNSQSLDHILVSDALAPGSEFDIVHTNAEFAETDSRASDHDPLVALFDFTPTETVKVNFLGLGFFGSFAKTRAEDIKIVDGAFETEILRDRAFQFRRQDEIELDTAGVRIGTGDDHSDVIAQSGAIGVVSRGERFFDRGELNPGEELIFSFDNEVESLDLKVKGRGQLEVDLAFFSDGELVQADTFDFNRRKLSVEADDRFDEVRVTSDDDIRVSSFAFEQVADLSNEYLV